ncbi:MAG: hypothetical protein RDV41_06830, partial [Planctomycetota bacterium]|nr:hypothetical protein [Planctomycetota bacterium]
VQGTASSSMNAVGTRTNYAVRGEAIGDITGGGGGTFLNNAAVYGRSAGNQGTAGGGLTAYGVYGVANATETADGQYLTNYGVFGSATNTTGIGSTANNAYGLYGTVSGAGTANYGVYATASGATTNWAGYFAGNVGLGGTATAPELRIYEATGTGTSYSAFKAQDQSVNLTYTLPAAYPIADGYFLASTTAGALSWSNDVPGGDSSYIWNGTAAQTANFNVQNTGATSIGQIVATATGGTLLTLTQSYGTGEMIHFDDDDNSAGEAVHYAMLVDCQGITRFRVSTNGDVYTTGTTLDLGVTNLARTINIGTGTLADTINIGIGDTTAETIAIGTGNAAKTVNLGTGTAGNAINIGTGANTVAQNIAIANGNSAANSTVSILAGAPSAGTQTLNVMSGVATGGTQTVNILTGTGGTKTLNLGTGNVAKTVSLGTGTGVDTINIGTGGTGVDVMTIGSSVSTLSIPAEILGANALVFEGATQNAFETTFAITDPSVDRTITFPNATGTVLLNQPADMTGFVATDFVNAAYPHWITFEMVISLEWAYYGTAHIVGYENDNTVIISWHASNGDGTMSWGEAEATEASGAVLFGFGTGNERIRVRTSGVAGSEWLIVETMSATLNPRVSLMLSNMMSGTVPQAGTAGRILYDNGTAWTALAAGTSNQVLVCGGGGAPSWANAISGSANPQFGVTTSSTVANNMALNVSQTGATVGTDYAIYANNTGAATTNVGLYATATGATNNYAAIFNAGYVGIGTTGPGTRLQVVESGLTAGMPVIASRQDDDGTWGLVIGNNTLDSAIGRGLRLWVDSTGAARMESYVSAAYKNLFFAPSGGNVGIGTASPEGKLSVNGDLGVGDPASTDQASHMVDIASTKGSAGFSAIRALYPGGGGLLGTEFGALAHRDSEWKAVYAKAGTGGAIAMYTDGEVDMMNGYVGIGTTTPQTTLHVESRSDSYASVRVGSDNTLHAGIIFFTSAADWTVGVDNTDSGKFKWDLNNWIPGNSTMMTLDTSGRLGIGTTTPGSQKLYSYQTGVAGTGYATSSVNALYGYGGGATYSFGVAGYDFGSTVRSGGTHGAYSAATWGTLGYYSSASTAYGAYWTSSGSGAGYLGDNVQTGIGSGGYGGVMGGWVRGEVLGFTSAGELYASYNLGDEYTSGVQAEIVNLPEKRVAVYASTSTDVKVNADGYAQLSNGICEVKFDPAFAEVISGEGRPTVTATPLGECEGVFITDISSAGFTVKEAHGGASNVEFTWIAVARRIDHAARPRLPQAIADTKFDDNLKGVMFNESNLDRSATPIWWDGAQLRFDNPPMELTQKTEPSLPERGSQSDSGSTVPDAE